MRVAFHKMHGLGNDFVVLDARVAPIEVDPRRARAIADRHRGIGCDQLIVIDDSDQADVSMRIWNADGSEVAACGNATRCVAALVGHDCTIETPAGLLRAEPSGEGARVDMGSPRYNWDEIPLAMPMDTFEMPVAWEMLEHPVAISMGNPHLVFFVPDVDAIPLEEIGPTIEHDPLFPERINVNIAQLVGPGHLRMRTWERGAGLTRACGTGACAVFVAARRTGHLRGDEARIDLPGGTLTLAYDHGHILMSGPAVHVFTGEFETATFA